MATTGQSPKAAHYIRELSAVLLRGAWGESTPGHAPNASALSWPELLRKYRKHTSDDEFSNVANATQALSLLLIPSSHLSASSTSSSNVTAEVLDGDWQDQKAPFNVGTEGLLPEERKAEAESVLSSLGTMSEKPSVRESILLARAHYAYALGNPSECLSILSSVELDPTVSQSIPPSSSPHPAQLAAEKSASNRGSNDADALRSLAGSGSALDSRIGWWAIERIRARCEEGMSHESLNKPTAASRAYDEGVKLIELLNLVPSPLVPTTPTAAMEKVTLATFREQRELWRWIERLLRRRAILAARHQPADQALSSFSTYRTYTRRYPAAFRPSHNTTILSLHLRALCLAPPFTLSSPTSTPISSSSPSYMVRRNWYRDARDIAERLRDALNVSTKFPRAGEVNWGVLHFVDLCMAVWERGGGLEEECDWVIDIMWWATRLTFHSHRILRHLTRLQLAQGDFKGAKRTLLLYVQLVTKSRQTSSGETSLQLKRRPTDLPAEHPDALAEEDAEENEGGEEEGEDSDADDVFLSMLLLGVRMLCRYGVEEDVVEARTLVDVAREVIGDTGTDGSGEESPKWKGWSRSVRAEYLTVRGVLSMRMIDFEPLEAERPLHLSRAHSHLLAASALSPSRPSSSTFFHLALVQSALRDADAAVLSARRAVELSPEDVRCWHLLGLLLTAQEEWENALQVIELGLIRMEEASEEGVTAQPNGNGQAVGANGAAEKLGVESRDFASLAPNGSSGANTPNPTASSPPAVTPTILATTVTNTSRSFPSVVSPKARSAPPAYLLHYDITTIPPQRTTERFESAIQTLLTQLTISERFEGAERATERWPEVFAFFSSRCPSGAGGVDEGGSHSFEQITSHPETINGQATSEQGHVPRIDVLPSSPTVTDYSAAGVGARSEPQQSQNRLSVHRRILQGHRPHNPLHRRKHGRQSISSEGPAMNGTYLTSAPDLHGSEYYQASSIHSRRRSPVGSSYREPIQAGSAGALSMSERPLSPNVAPSSQSIYQSSQRTPGENRLLAEIWLTSAATFRRMGRLDQAKSAIMEAEALDEENPNVWVQYALYLSAVKEPDQAIESLSKALILDPDHVSATVHLSQIFLDPNAVSKARLDPIGSEESVRREAIDMAAGILDSFTRRAIGWNVAEAWYFLGKAVGLQGRLERQRECLAEALRLEEGRPLRALSIAFPPCL